MAKMLPGWLTRKVFSLITTLPGKRFGNRQVSAAQGSRILMNGTTPTVNIPLLDRIVASITRTSLISSLAKRAGLNLAALSTMSEKAVVKMVRTLSGRRALQLFYLDATTNNSVLLSRLMENHPDILEQLVLSLTKDERRWVMKLFGEPAPELSPPAAENCALMLARLGDRTSIAPVLDQLLSHSGMETGAAALTGLFYGHQLDFGLVAGISRKYAQDHDLSDQGQDMVSACHAMAKQGQNVPLATHLQVFMELMYKSLPKYKEYWASCTRLPAHDCPVSDSFPSLEANLSQLTPETVKSLCHATSEDELTTLATNLGWRKIQSRSSATLRNPDAATGDFLCRTFAESQPQFQQHWQTSL